MEIQNPHDKFFKTTFGSVAIARDFLSNYLPKDLADVIDLDTLELQKNSYIDKEFKESFSDLLFKAGINGREGYIYMLFEHKSYPSRDVAFQLLKYMVRIWEREIKELDYLPVILPLVIYHGKDKWNIGQKLEDIVLGYENMPGEVRRFIPNYSYLLYDLSEFTDEEIKGGVRNRIAIAIMRDVQRGSIGDILEILYEAAKLLRELEDKETGLEYFETLVRYVFGTRADFLKSNYEELVERIETTYPEGSDVIMTIAERFREEGVRIGIEKGIEKGKRETLAKTAIKFLTKKFGYLPKDLREKILELDVITLEIIIDNIFDYESLDDVERYVRE